MGDPLCHVMCDPSPYTGRPNHSTWETVKGFAEELLPQVSTLRSRPLSERCQPDDDGSPRAERSHARPTRSDSISQTAPKKLPTAAKKRKPRGSRRSRG